MAPYWHVPKWAIITTNTETGELTIYCKKCDKKVKTLRGDVNLGLVDDAIRSHTHSKKK